MSFRSRSRLAADWFAKLRTNDTTGAVEQADVVDATTALETQLAEANATIDSLQSTISAGIDADTLDGEQGAYYYSAANPPPSSAPTTSQVANATKSIGAGAVGSYAFLYCGTTTSTGGTRAGSSLQYAGTYQISGLRPSGTWRCMGYSPDRSLWLRIA